MTTLQVHLEGIGLYGPGLAGWSQARQVLDASLPVQITPVQLPAPEALPPAERRRVGVALKLAMAAGFEAVARAEADASALTAVFSSTGGDCDNCHLILEGLAAPQRSVSPTRFHNSVHNMPAGYWSIATKCMAPTTSLCAYDATFAAGLLEAASQANSTQAPCLLVAYDTAYPQPLQAHRPIPHAFGVAMVLSPKRTPRSSASLSIGLGDAAPTLLADADLEQLRTSVPAARSLPLLRALARGESAAVVIDYLDDLSLDVEVRPC
jgi:hypothetical protein